MPEPLLFGEYYHIDNRGNNGEALFRDERNPSYFLDLCARYVEPIAQTYAYCLLTNHFHFLVRIRDYEDLAQAFSFCRDWRTHAEAFSARAFSSLFSTYAKAFNRRYRRTGSLFEKPFQRRLVDSDGYFISLVTYIHRNPRKRGFVEDFRDWPFSSYRAILSAGPTRVQRAAVLEWFDGREVFVNAHQTEVDEGDIAPLVAGDWGS